MKPGEVGQRLECYGFAAPAPRWPPSAIASAAIPGALPAARTRIGGSTSTGEVASANIMAEGDSATVCCHVVVNDRVIVDKTSDGVTQTLCSVKSA